MVKYLLVLLFSGLIYNSAFARTSNLLFQASDSQFKEVHQNLINMMIEIDANSHHTTTYRTIQNLWNLLMSQAHADQGKRCFYGGWISFEKNGECLTPWQAKRSGPFANEFKTNKCFDQAKGFDKIFDHYSTPKEESKEGFTATLENGIQNKCTMIINDYDDRIATHGKNIKCKARMYYINLCKSEPEVIKDYSYVGFGTCKGNKGFKNETDQGTTLLGFSVTSSEAFAFAKSDASYNAIRKKLDGRIPSVSLFGLQNSNNRSSTDYKYLHVGAYTSAGCPSIDPSNAWMIDEMASDGPSVVVGYKEGEMESFDKCGDE